MLGLGGMEIAYLCYKRCLLQYIVYLMCALIQPNPSEDGDGKQRISE
jgi:hypothetical protein